MCLSFPDIYFDLVITADSRGVNKKWRPDRPRPRMAEATEKLGEEGGSGGRGGRGTSREDRCSESEGGFSRSIKLPQTMDVALRNIKDAKVRMIKSLDIICHIVPSDFCHGHRWKLDKDCLLLRPPLEENRLRLVDPGLTQ